MASESGYSNQKKKGISQFKTIHSLGSDKFGTSVAGKSLFEKMPSASIVSSVDVDGLSGQVDYILVEITSHGAILGDILRIDAGDLINYEFDIVEIVDTDFFKIPAIVEASLVSGVIGSIMGWVTNKVNPDGSGIVSLAPAPAYFLKDAILEAVNLDTGTPANSVGLPINQLNADGTLFDPQVFTDLSLKLPATLGQKVTADALAVALSTEQEAKIDLLATEVTLASLEAKDFATETTLTDILGRLPDIGQQPLAASLSVGLAPEQEVLLSDISDSLIELKGKMAGSLVPDAHDEIVTTYVGATTAIDTVTYKLAAATVATLTMTYDGSDRLISVVRS
jgi:hypothetical protein